MSLEGELAQLVRDAVRSEVREALRAEMTALLVALKSTANAEAPDDRLVDVVTASTMLGLGERTVRKHIATGRLRSVLVGASRRIPLSAVRALVEGKLASADELMQKRARALVEGERRGRNAR